jgi:predicted XRE-type DNA-binding protein
MRSSPFISAGEGSLGAYAELVRYITNAGMTQSRAARQFGVTQPRISDLTRGKVDLFSIDTLVNMLTAAGLQLDLHVRAAI